MFLFIHYYSKHFLNVYRNARKKEQMFYPFLFSTNYGGLAWVSLLLFLLSYPLQHSSLGITLAFLLSYPLLHSVLDIRLTFHSLIPTTPLCSGYHACFSALHTHYSILLWVLCLLFYSHTHIGTRNKNFLRSTGRNKQNDSLPPKTAANISIILELFP